MNQINFQSENLVVHWISLNIKSLTNVKSIAKIAIYLSRFGFNSDIKSSSKANSEPVIAKMENEWKVLFICSVPKPGYKNYWPGTTVSFSGSNASAFYNLIQTEVVDLNIFDLRNTNLGRFDIHYLREPKATDQNEQLEIFMDHCCKKIHAQSKQKHASWLKNKKGLILKIGSRQSSNYYRVYQKSNGIEFELEIKKKVAKSVQEFLFTNQFEEFEKKLSKYFYRRSQISLVLDTCYTDWLLICMRKLREKQDSPKLLTTYLKSSNSDKLLEQEQFLIFIQFISFISQTRTHLSLYSEKDRTI